MTRYHVTLVSIENQLIFSNFNNFNFLLNFFFLPSFLLLFQLRNDLIDNYLSTTRTTITNDSQISPSFSGKFSGGGDRKIRITVARGTMMAQDEYDEDSGWNSCAQSRHVVHGVPRTAKARLL